ncbi:MAG TPA: ATP-binding cassette domain-containing protein, partial [Candidatus Dormibacteraeota bacterium]|nr:ATP-binding cassette domain-containing protein [Candidatus Dormibacteraeota bacterium]
MTEASAALDLLPASKADLSAEPVAEVESLRVQFRRDGNQIFAVRGIDLTIQPGEVIGLVGESGSGKSVLGLSLL